MFNLDVRIPAARLGVAPTTGVWPNRTNYIVWNRTDNVWEDSGKDAYTAPTLMSPYMEGSAYQVLQSPADALDGGENGEAVPVATPYQIESQQDVCWYNISYLYVAGLNTALRPVFFVGDETNAVDWSDSGGDANPGGGSLSGLLGTFRKDATNVNERGYSDVDNHGTEGGNFARTDGSAAWIKQTRNGITGSTDIIDQSAAGFDPHDVIFLDIADAFRSPELNNGENATTLIQTID